MSLSAGMVLPSHSGNLMLELRNPHSIRAVLESRPRAVRQLTLQSENPPEPWAQVLQMALEFRVPVSYGHAGSSQRRGRRQTERTGAGSAQVEPPSPVPQELLFSADQGGADLWLALDRVQDPQNLGAIFRLAGFFGVRGVVMTKDQSASVNGTVCDVSAGGTESVPFSVVPNLAQAMARAQESGIWVLGTCERAESSIYDVVADRNWMLVVGNEGQGMRRLTRERCDQLVAMPPRGAVGSLNVATAAAACLSVLCSPRGC